MTTTLSAASFPTTSVAGNAASATFVPSELRSAGGVVFLQIFSTNTVTLNSVTDSLSQMTVSPQIQFGTSTPYSGGQPRWVVGLLFSSVTSRTISANFSAAPGTSFLQFYDFKTNLATPQWTFDLVGYNNSGNSATALTKSGIILPKRNIFMLTMEDTQTSSPTGSSNAQGWLTYDTTNQLVYGDVPVANVGQTLPQTGFTQTSQPWGMDTLFANPTPLWTPPSVNLQAA